MNRREMLNWIKLEICPKLDLSQELDIKCILDVVGYYSGKEVNTAVNSFLNTYAF